MEETLRNFADIGLTVLMLGAFCCFPVIAIAGTIFGAAVSLRDRKAGERLSPELGLRIMNNETHPLRAWYGGKHQGRDYAIQSFLVGSDYYFDGRRRTSWSASLRVAMPLNDPTLSGINVTRNRRSKQPQNFAEAFLGENHQQLSPNAQRAVYGFAKKGEPTGLRKSGRLSFSRGRRRISLVDRHGKAGQLLGDVVYPDAHAVLFHDISDGGVSADELRSRLSEMVELAQAIETGAPARSLDPDAIPEEAAWRRHAVLALVLFIAIGLPAFGCVCASTLVAMGGGS